MMDLKNYNALKAKGLINKVQKTNTENEDALTYAVYIKRFQLDGAEAVQLSDEVVSVTHAELVARRAEVIASTKELVDSIDAFIADAVNGS